MLQMLEPYLDRVPPRKYPKYQVFLDNVVLHLQRHVVKTERSIGYHHPGMAKLKHILHLADIKYYESKNWDFISIYQHLVPLKVVLDNSYDMQSTGQEYSDLFLSGSGSEYLVPIDEISPTTRLPLMESKWYLWERIQPFYIHWVDTLELNWNIINSKVRYEAQPPQSAIITIDSISLVLKYLAWRRYGTNLESRPEEALTTEYFLHRYVIRYILEQLTNIWLLHAISLMLENEFVGEVVNTLYHRALVDSQYTYIGPRLSDGIRVLRDEIQTVVRNTHPSVFLNSPLLLYQKSIMDVVEYRLYKTPIRPLQSYEAYGILRDLDLYKLILQIWRFNPDLPQTKKIYNLQERLLRRMVARKPWSKIRNSNVSRHIENKIRTLFFLMGFKSGF